MGIGTRSMIVAVWLVGVFAVSQVHGDPLGNGAGERHYDRVEARYRLPEVTLRNRDGASVRLRELLNADRPVLVQFIFTSCQSICPMLTAMMSQAQEAIRSAAPASRIVSISIDPEYDTPGRLAAYARKHNAQGDWHFLTGAWPAIRRTMNAFDAMYEGKNKMYHKPYTYMRPAGDGTWVRLTGLMGAQSLANEYRRVLSSAESSVVASERASQQR